MEKFKLPRIGQADLVFEGERIGSASNRQQSGNMQNRYNDCTLYKTKAGNYVVQKEYITQWQNEKCSSEVLVFKTAKELASWVQEQIKNQVDYSIELLKGVANDSDIDELKEIFIETLE